MIKGKIVLKYKNFNNRLGINFLIVVLICHKQTNICKFKNNKKYK